MNWILLTVGAGVFGAGIGWLAARRQSRPGLIGGVDPHLLPDPALRWLQRSHKAIGAWIAEPSQEGSPARWQRVLDQDRLSGAQLESVEQRLRSSRDQAGSGVERLESGTLLFGSAAGIGAGILLPEPTTKASLQEASDDLVALLEGLARRPLFLAAEADSEPVESVGSIGLRLAYQLERILDAEVIVGVRDKGSVRVIGVSGRADRRLIDSYAVAGSPLAQVGLGEVPSLTTNADPLGGAVPDRRSRFSPAILLPIKSGEEPVGAVAFWAADEAEPIGPVIAEVREAIRNAGPRIVRAFRFGELKAIATVDPLTGLKNRRGLEEMMSKLGVQQGALVSADLDRFKVLNDTLGHPAGDAALVHFARLVHEQIRGGDTAARVGGEEFSIWLPNAALSFGMQVADRIRVRVGTTPWDWQGRPWPLSASFGVAAVPETTRSLQNLAAQADAALYAAKEAGRNRVQAASSLPRLATPP